MEIIKLGYKTVCHFGELAEKAKGEQAIEKQDADQANVES